MRLLGQTTAQLASWWPGWAQLRAAPPRPPHPSSDLGHGPARRPARPAPARDRHGHRTRSTFIKCNQKIFYSKDKILFAPADVSPGRVGRGCVRSVCARYCPAVARCGRWRPVRKYCTQLSCEKSAEWRRPGRALPPRTSHNSFPRLSTSSTTPSARGPWWWWWRCAGWRLETVEITPGPGPARPVTHIQAVTQSRGNAAQHCPAQPQQHARRVPS